MKLKDLQKGEFWISTALYIFALIILISNANNRDYDTDYYLFKGEGITYSFFSNYLVPKAFQFSMIYFSFLLLNFCVLPSILNKRNELLNYFIIILLIGVVGLVSSICTTYSQAYILVEYDTLQQAYNRIFFRGFTNAIWMVVIMVAYKLIKEFIIHLAGNREKNQSREEQIKVDISFGLAFWFIGILLMVTTRADFEPIAIWSLVIFAAVGIVAYSVYYLLPSLVAKGKKRFWAYFKQVFFISLLLAVPMSLLSAIFWMGRAEGIFVTFLFHIPTQLALTAPLAWYIYKRRTANDSEIYNLRTELGKTDATLSFLQSQINPHFLFNALNTLYGTALQENAERTGEGIQKLGDMMRFMLHENVQDKISLTRDIDYLQNYISLQKLRTSRSADITIETQIEEQIGSLEITPMLLIPFVENAFKHGISLQNPSHIKVTLQTKGSTLYFDVHNSIHIKPDNDPEKLKSGIGLENVKNRLKLLYPKKHELIIRESAKEFFIHLTIEL